ncbi:hypothetical protein KW797_00460 [Candidatus Parcubacteria bacterium]|nr:hypothetical protein [Candidatus Parcubacteria bacterium]
MADNSTPTSGSPTASAATTPDGGTGTGAPSTTPTAPIPGDPKIPTDSAAAAAYWESRAKEATAQATRDQQKNARYREQFGELEASPAPAQTTQPQTVNVEAIVEAKLQEHQLTQQIQRTPSLLSYTDEIKGLVKGGLSVSEAKETVAKRHNVVLAPSIDSDIELMPTAPGGGGSPSSSGGAGLSPEHEQSLLREGGNLEAAKKHMPLINRVWQKAARR